MSPQTNSDPLAQLHDVMAPNMPSWWPLATIYWFLIFAAIGLAVVVTYLFKRNKKNQQKQKQAQLQLQQLKQSKANFVLLNQLLKGVALRYFPRQQVASLHGEKWLEFLQHYSLHPLFDNKQVFVQRLYHGDAQACTENDYEQAKIWINNLPMLIKKRQKEVNSHV